MSDVLPTVDGRILHCSMSDDYFVDELLQDARIEFFHNEFRLYIANAKQWLYGGEYFYHIIDSYSAVLSFRPSTDSGRDVMVDMLLTFDQHDHGHMCTDVYNDISLDVRWQTPRSQMSLLANKTGRFSFQTH